MAFDSFEEEDRGPARPAVDSNPRALQILQATDELLAERGHDAVSMRDVALRAGVNKALIFYYFGSRAQLFDAVLARHGQNHEDALRVLETPRANARDRVHSALDAYLDFVEGNGLFVHLVQQELSRQDPQLQIIRDNLTRLHAVLADALGAVLPTRGPTATRQLFLTISTLVLSHGPSARALGAMLGEELDSPEARAERRAHLHWLADTLLERLGRPQA